MGNSNLAVDSKGHSKKSYFVELESLRGIAAVSVAVLHTSHWYFFKGFSSFENLKYFVDFFFVLSGFVISYNFLNTVKNRDDFRLYMVKRFFRLYPLFVFASIPFLLISLLKTYWGMDGFNAVSKFNSYDFLFYITMIYKWGFVEGTPFNYPSWSISVELLLYVIAGLSFLWISKRKYHISLNIFLASISLIILATQNSTLGAIGNYVAFRGLLSFSTGSLVYFLFSSKRSHPIISSGLKMVFLLATLCCSAYLFLYAKQFSYLSFAFPVLWAVVIYLVIADRYPSFVIKILNINFIKEIGKVSYSFYLIHALIISLTERLLQRSLLENNGLICLLGLIVYLGSAFFIARLTFRYIEMPGKDLYKAFTRGKAVKLNGPVVT